MEEEGGVQIIGCPNAALKAEKDVFLLSACMPNVIGLLYKMKMITRSRREGRGVWREGAEGVGNRRRRGKMEKEKNALTLYFQERISHMNGKGGEGLRLISSHSSSLPKECHHVS